MNSNLNIKVSVVIITKNRADFITKAIESVQEQSAKDWELIILDDDSRDETEAIVKNFGAKDARIRYIRNSAVLGISKNRNKGVSLSNAEYIAMLDSDDYWTDKDKLKKQINILDKDNSVGLIGSTMTCIRKDGSIIGVKKTHFDDKSIRNNMLISNQIFQSSVVFRKKAFNEVGGYDETLEVAEDYDLWLKIGKKNKFANLEESTINYLIHENNVSKSILKVAISVDKIIERYKKNYPGYLIAKIVSILRIIKALFNNFKIVS